MGTFLILLVICVVVYFAFFKKKTVQTTQVSPFHDGEPDNEVIQFADAFLLISNKYPDDCRFALHPSGAFMHFACYSGSHVADVLINRGDYAHSAEYMRMIDFLGEGHGELCDSLGIHGNTDCGWTLRNYGHAIGDSWDSEIKKPISKATAEKVYTLLKTSSRLTVNHSDHSVSAVLDTK